MSGLGFPSDVGSFVLGSSPIAGFFAWQDTVISQYANSQIILQLIDNFSQYVDQSANIQAFFDNMWNIDTAQGYGLDVWGRILGISRTLQVASGFYFGFDEAGAEAQPFGQGQFFSGQPLTNNYNLSDAAYRTLLLAKALANICDGSIPAINQLLLNLFPGRGNCYVTEGEGLTTRYFGFDEAGTVNSEGFNTAPFYSGQSFGIMSMTYTFAFPLTPVEFAILEQSGVLPTPTGVLASIVLI